jgi:hypothetical protein
MATLTPGSAAAEDATDQCMASYVSAQKLLKKSQLVEAKRELLACGQESCHKSMRGDCVQWLREVEERVPTVVVAAKDAAGNDLVAAKLFIDGQMVRERLDGSAIALNPGLRKFELIVGDGDPVAREVLVREGQRSRMIQFEVKPPPADVPPATEPATPVAGATPPEGDDTDDKGHPVAAYVFGAVGVVALGSFLGFGIAGKSDADELRDSCGVTSSCPDSEIDDVRTKLIVADISLGVGLVALGVGVGLFLHHHLSGSDDEAESAEAGSALWFGASPTRGGALGSVGGRF